MKHISQELTVWSFEGLSVYQQCEAVLGKQTFLISDKHNNKQLPCSS